MALDPDDILTRTFSRNVMGGYSTSEVAEFFTRGGGGAGGAI